MFKKIEPPFFDVSLPTEDLKKALESVLNSKHSKLISEMIIQHLSKTPKGCAHLYMALTGLTETIPFDIDDDVFIKKEHIPGWRINKDFFIEGVNMFNDLIPARVTDIDITRVEPVEITYTAQRANSEEMFEHTDWHYVRHLVKKDIDFLID